MRSPILIPHGRALDSESILGYIPSFSLDREPQIQFNLLPVVTELQLESQEAGGKMLSVTVVAKESQLGRSENDAAITRRSLMEELATRGMRMTKQRRLLVGIIQNSSRHLDAASLLEIAKKQDSEINRATVYRTIALLKERGLIDELDLMHLEGEKHYYEVKTSRDHCHMACFRCGAIMEYASPSFEKLKTEMAKQSGFEIKVVRLEVGGLCQRCRKAAA
ncbi:MAG: Fur family transcriptional regulator [Candidatus Acidiferrales bacterium]